jgi:hypothetical protein
MQAVQAQAPLVQQRQARLQKTRRQAALAMTMMLTCHLTRFGLSCGHWATQSQVLSGESIDIIIIIIITHVSSGLFVQEQQAYPGVS